MSFYLRDPYADTTIAKVRRTVGHEVEYASGAGLGALLEANGTGIGALHGYGCECSAAMDFPVHGTSDCTAGGGEYIIGGNHGVLFGSERYAQAIQVLADGAIEMGCEISESVGMHTHVDISDLSLHARFLLFRNYLALQDEFLVLASGPMAEVRNNGNVSSHVNVRHYIRDDSMWTRDIREINFNLPGRPTINFYGCNENTCEFRVWNSTKAAWRMYLAGGISTALVQASFDGHSAGKPGDTSLRDFLFDYLTDDLLILMDRQVRSKGE